ncbi:Protein of unknown function [Cotesia congregata]|uniref:Uncharacterized protein n=1 Tax=Cotesia congregata TaxID=51543 RepID=A0A8J2E8K1_COTCN|nr:Protein of unknown function [Cotesia congregata]
MNNEQLDKTNSVTRILPPGVMGLMNDLTPSNVFHVTHESTKLGEWAQQLNIIYEIGYTISLIALILSLGILTYFRDTVVSRANCRNYKAAPSVESV